MPLPQLCIHLTEIINMKDLAIYGMGGFGREVACLVKFINDKEESPQWNLIGFFDDGIIKGSKCEYGVCLGGLSELNNWQTPLDIVISIGTPEIIKHLANSINNPNVSFPNIIASDICWYDFSSVSFGKGNIISRECQFSCNVKLGDFNVFNYRVDVGHDVSIGNYNSIMTEAKIAGNVTIGDMNYIGVNSVILQGIKVGNNTTLAAGSVAMRRTKDGYTFMGVPASAWIMTKKK